MSRISHVLTLGRTPSPLFCTKGKTGGTRNKTESPYHPFMGKIKSSVLAGAGGGTLVVVFAKTLPQPWASWLVIAAPSLSVGMSASFLWAKQYIEKQMEQRE
jgi:hypothetical protein